MVTRDSDYQTMIKEFKYTEHTLQEITLKVENLQKELSKAMDSVQELLSKRSQAAGSVEYFLPASLITNVASVQREVNNATDLPL